MKPVVDSQKGVTSVVKSNQATKALSSALLIPLLFVASCGSGETSEGESTLTTSLTPSETPTFSAKQVGAVTTQDPDKEITDPGLNVQWKIRSVNSGPNGGAVVVLNLKNLNDVPLPPSALGQPTLKTSSGNVELMNPTDEDDPPNGLDLPLGALATTTVRYTFNTTVASTSKAELQIANVIWQNGLQ